MITMLEFLKGTPINDLSIAFQHNAEELLKRINIIRKAYNKSMVVSSGFRSLQNHIRVYNQKGIFDTKKIPMRSLHLSAEAIDIYDPNGELKKWVIENVSLLEEVGLWCEDFAYTSTWVHFQIKPPKSEKRFFIP